MTYFEKFSESLKSYFGAHSVFLFSKGRVGLYAVLKAMNIGPGDEVLLPGYTCMVVPNAILAVGATPKYVDIDTRTYNLSLDKLKDKYTPKTKVLILQHTYGIPCPYQPFREWAESHGLLLIEDCCHAFGSRYDGQLCGTYGHAAFFSGQWNKPFSTGLGGMLAVKEENLTERINDLVESELITPSFLYNLRMRLQIMLYRGLVNPRTVSYITKIYRMASAVGLTVGSSTNCEFSAQLPPNYFMGMAETQAKMGFVAMKHLNDNVDHRRQLSRFYDDELSKYGFSPVKLLPEEDCVFLRYPVRVKNKKQVLSLSYKKGMEIGSWFESPLHPENITLEPYAYSPGECPVAEKAAQEVINLPTHSKITPTEAERLLRFLKEVGEPV